MHTLQQPQPQLASHAASAIYNIAQACRDLSQETTNVLSAPMLLLLKALLATADRDDAHEGNLRIGATSAIAELIMSGAEDSVAIYKDFLPTVLERLERAYQMQALTAEDKDDKESLIAQFCGIAQMIFMRLSPADGFAQADRAMTILLKVVQLPNATCLEDAFLVISAVASCLDADFAVSTRLWCRFMLCACHTRANLFLHSSEIRPSCDSEHCPRIAQRSSTGLVYHFSGCRGRHLHRRWLRHSAVLRPNHGCASDDTVQPECRSRYQAGCHCVLW